MILKINLRHLKIFLIMKENKIYEKSEQMNRFDSNHFDKIAKLLKLLFFHFRTLNHIRKMLFFFLKSLNNLFFSFSVSHNK